MLLAALESRIDELVQELAQYRGFRTVWLSEAGELVHSEPDEMLEVRGFVYLTTVFRPDHEELSAAALKYVEVELGEPVREAIASWEATPVGPLVPAM